MAHQTPRHNNRIIWSVWWKHLEYLEMDTCDKHLHVKYLEHLQMEAYDVRSMVNGTPYWPFDSQYGADF